MLSEIRSAIWSNRVEYVDWLKIAAWVEQDIKIAEEKYLKIYYKELFLCFAKNRLLRGLSSQSQPK